MELKIKLTAADPDSLELLKYAKRLAKAKTEDDKKFIANQITAITDRIKQKKEEAEQYFART